jgi:hypothetical protein
MEYERCILDEVTTIHVVKNRNVVHWPFEVVLVATLLLCGEILYVTRLQASYRIAGLTRVVVGTCSSIHFRSL